MRPHKTGRMKRELRPAVTLYMPRHRGKLIVQAQAAGMSPSAYVCALLDYHEDIKLAIDPKVTA